MIVRINIGCIKISIIEYCSQVSLLVTITGAEVLTSRFDRGEGMIWLDNVECAGSEGRLIDCFASEPGVHSCDHSQDAGIRCGWLCVKLTKSGW